MEIDECILDNDNQTILQVPKTQEKILDLFVQEVATEIPAANAIEKPPEKDLGLSNQDIPKSDNQLLLSHEVRHEVAIPENFDYIPISKHVQKRPQAREYPFKLDPFQQLAVICLERNESVLVSAHTSAGKTVIAEYAIAIALRDHQRVIYTSPIKALSNQKYRELQEAFTDVGLMTGDVTINQEASCLVMTTEILRSMLYRGSEVMREVSWVIFDEVHYMRDKERGVVWEETLIMLPDTVRYVFLSATIPNAKQFARWICHLHSQPCHVVYTNYRPTPLQHYLFPSGADGLYLVMDEKGIFKDENFSKALSFFNEEQETQKKPFKTSPHQNTSSESDLYRVIKMLASRSCLPVIIFSFSKKDCEGYALQMSKLDFNSDDEKKLLMTVFRNAISGLSEEDRVLPQIESIVPLLKRGIGIHHGGLLPILKEVIEILFQEGLIKVLFATETFSIGLNMPAKTVIFTSVRKFDGKDFRWISSGEYIQMSGRAGRRGLDDRGIVIMMLNERMDPSIAKNMIKGQADHLNSAFHLEYNMILNMMRVDGFSPEIMLDKSFFQFQNADSIPALREQLEEITKCITELGNIENEHEIVSYQKLQNQLNVYLQEFRRIVNSQTNALPFLQPGRLIKVHDYSQDIFYGWCVVINVQKQRDRGSINRNNKNSKHSKFSPYLIDVLSQFDYEQLNRGAVSNNLISAIEPRIFPVSLSCLDGISSIRIRLPHDLSTLDSKLQIYRSINEVKKRFSTKIGDIPLLDPIVDMNIKDQSFLKLLKSIEDVKSALNTHPLHMNSNTESIYTKFNRKQTLEAQAKNIKKFIRQATSILQMEELKARKNVLRELGFTSSDDVIELKGRVACEISTGDELLLTELMFSGAFNSLSSEQISALLSCFVCEEKADDSVRLREDLLGPLKLIQSTAEKIAKISNECNLKNMDQAEYVQKFRPELMDIVYSWCRGARFAKICSMTDVFEGNIIRCLRRLEELLRQMSQAARSIGNIDLETKFNDANAKLKRDIVFANSLYL